MKQFKLTELQKTVASILILGAVAALIVLVLSMYPVAQQTGATQQQDALIEPVAAVVFQCAEGKEFLARIEVRPDASPENPGMAEVYFIDGSVTPVLQTIAASGVRYATANESLVFWMKGETAFIEQDGATTYQDCVATVQ